MNATAAPFEQYMPRPSRHSANIGSSVENSTPARHDHGFVVRWIALIS